MQKATQIFQRLTEVEKIHLRAASADRVDFLADTAHRADMPNSSQTDRFSVMKEVQALCLLEFASKSAQPGFNGTTWKF